MPDIFSEVDEEVRRERMLKIWKRFGPFLVAAVVTFIAGMGGKIYWDQWRERLRIGESDRYQQALVLLTQGNSAPAKAILEDLGANSKFGYRLLARLQIASNLAREGQRAAALGAFDALAADTDLERRYREYAALMAASLAIDEGELDAALARLQPLMAEEAPWKFSARELYGTALYFKGDFDGAEKAFTALLGDTQAPPDLQGRAQEMLLVLETAPRGAKPLAEGGEAVADHADGE